MQYVPAGALLDFWCICIYPVGQALPEDWCLSVCFLDLIWCYYTELIWTTLSSVGFGWILLVSFICEQEALSEAVGMVPAFYKRILFMNRILSHGLMPIVWDDCFLASPVNSLNYFSLLPSCNSSCCKADFLACSFCLASAWGRWLPLLRLFFFLSNGCWTM